MSNALRTNAGKLDRIFCDVVTSLVNAGNSKKKVKTMTDSETVQMIVDVRYAFNSRKNIFTTFSLFGNNAKILLPGRVPRPTY